MMVDVRPYHTGDLAACRGLWAELTEWHRDLYGAPEIGGDDPGRKFDTHLARVGAERLWVADDAGSVVGLVGLMEGADDNIEIEIEPVVVAASRRGQGIGRQLVARAVAEAQAAGHGSLSVRVVARNGQAIAFYHDAGFQVLGMLELFQDFRSGERRWRPGERLADRDFLV